MPIIVVAHCEYPYDEIYKTTVEVRIKSELIFN